MSYARCWFALVSLFGVWGCSDAEPFGIVNGRVTLDGQPLGHGAISFDNAETKFAVAANLDERGVYVIRSVRHNGLPPGEYRVAISPATIGGGETPLIGDPSPRPGAAAKPIPQRYHSATTSGLSATVRVGENPPYNFDLTSAKPR
jgi:hypothetical protein